MQQVLSAFGIDWRLLLINSINFVLLLGVLWYYLYTPLLRVLSERARKVAQGVQDAEEAKEKLASAEMSRTELLTSAGKEADDVLARARKAATEKEREILNAGEMSAATILKDAEAAATELKAQALAESKSEVAKLIVLGVEKTLKEK